MGLKGLLIGGIILTITGTSAIAQNSKSNKVMDAVMNAYATELANDPNNYELLFSRANQYFINGNYVNALTDINEAMKYTPRSDNEVLFEEYMLRAKIYNIRKEYQNMANDATMALRINPTSLPALFASAEANYEVGNYENAKKDYQNILRQNNIDYEAFAGLARIAIKEQNIGQAREYVNKAVDLYPAQAAVYVNRANILSMIGEDAAAAHDLIHAVTLNYEKTDALQELVDMSNTNYDITIAALNDAIGKVPNSGFLIYLRSLIALNHNNYSDAIVDINRLISDKLYVTDGVYYDQATAYYNLCNYEESLKAIRNAITENADAGIYYVLHSKILQQLGNKKESLQTVLSTLAVEPNDAAALIQKASVLISMGKNKEALAALNEAIMNNPEEAFPYLVRANVKKLLKDKKGAEADYRQMLNLEDRSLKSYRGFALHNLGRDAEAKVWIEDALEENKVGGGEMFFIAAALYSQCGDMQKALDYMEGALANGYSSKLRLTTPDDSQVDLTLLKSNPRYTSLLEEYKIAK